MTRLRDWLRTRGRRTLARVAAVALTAHGGHGLAVHVGWGEWIAWLLPAATDVYVLAALQSRRRADRAVAITMMALVSALYHGLHDGEVSPVGILVSLLPVIVIWRVEVLDDQDQEPEPAPSTVDVPEPVPAPAPVVPVDVPDPVPVPARTPERRPERADGGQLDRPLTPEEWETVRRAEEMHKAGATWAEAARTLGPSERWLRELRRAAKKYPVLQAV